MIKILYILSFSCTISLISVALYLSLPDLHEEFYLTNKDHKLPFHDFHDSENNRDNTGEHDVLSFVANNRLSYHHNEKKWTWKDNARVAKNIKWQSYITSTNYSQNEILTPAYDSRNIWVTPTCHDYASAVPKRPTARFDQVIGDVCDKVNPEACKLFKSAFTDTWDNSAFWLKDGSVYLITGDIPMMWLRDSTAQIMPYLALADSPEIQQLIESVLKRQMKWIELDPYGSAFRMYLDFDHKGKTRLTDWDYKCGRTIHVAQHDYEMDSLSYVVRLAYLYWRKSGRTCWMDRQLQNTVTAIVDLWIHEQNHSQSSYRYPTLKNNGIGSKVCYTGMTWSGMRPSDDSMKFHYNIPNQLFAVTVLGYIQEMTYLWADRKLRYKAKQLQKDILSGVYKYGVIGKLLAYEVDGCGNYLLADDANIPSLLSLPYLGVNISTELYQQTRKFILSEQNPWYTDGVRVSGIGSPHTQGRGRVWHLALIMEGLTGGNNTKLLNAILATAKNGLHESVDASGTGYTRQWFGWANALFAEWLMQQSI